MDGSARDYRHGAGWAQGAYPYAAITATTPFVLAHLSDPHIGADWGDCDPVERLQTAVESVCALRPAPDAILITGDLADSAADREYERLKELLAPLAAPVYVLPGNHDDRAALARHFGGPGSGGEPVQYVAELGPLRLVVLDTSRPGHDGGRVEPDQLAWLDRELASVPGTPTVLAMHHPPLVTGVPALDAIAIPAEDRWGLAAVLREHAQVQRVLAGHVHRAIAGEIGGRAVLTIPSTYVQLKLDFTSEDLHTTAEAPAIAVHVLIDGGLISHVQTVGPDR
jgi:3',5'-cyclic-AMP phosphodiesterase